MPPKKPPAGPLKRIEKFVGNDAWDDFVVWCGRNNLTAVPANAWTLAAYLRSLEGSESLTKIKKRVADIGKAHAEKSRRRPERDPLITKTLLLLERDREKRPVGSGLFDNGELTEDGKSKTKLRSTKSEGTDKKPTRRTRLMRSTPKLVSKRRRP